MHIVKSTYKVLINKVLPYESVEDWKDWALEMMEAGFETEHLILLAGLSADVNRFQLEEIIKHTLKELTLDAMPEEEIVYGYVYYLIDQALSLKMSTKVILGTLRELCRDRDYDKKLFDFYLLSFARQDLEEAGEQFYWEGANADNIDTIINAQFLEWKGKYESMQVK
ncbi:hypothetical protein [Niastella sp. OAS944]|uniref:hypothetical protein n=1 Tax=Niastella sp. OAS944 TaxID=2664089 RepID=UPI00347F0EBE|nr:hypothetical protein [Chitinophagaceae bacterium OAS944]